MFRLVKYFYGMGIVGVAMVAMQTPAHGQAVNITPQEEQIVAETVRSCAKKAKLANSSMWAGLVSSSPMAVTGLMILSDIKTPPQVSALLLMGLSFAGAAVSGLNGTYVLFWGEDFRTLGAFAGELGYNAEGFLTRSYRNRCESRYNAEICQAIIQNMRALVRQGKLCEGW